MDPASEGSFDEFTDGCRSGCANGPISLDATNPPPYSEQVLVSLLEPNGDVSDFLQIFGQGSNQVDPGTIAYQFGSDPIPGLGTDTVLETGDWQPIGHFYGVVDSYVQIRSDVESAVPLPAALPLFASGLGGFGLMGWWRRRKRAQVAS